MTSPMKEQNATTKNMILVAAIALLAISNIATLIWMQIHPHTVEEQLAQYPLIDPARHFIPQEHFISTLQPLRERIHALVDAEKDLRISAYIEFLNTGANIIVNPGETYWPASLAKVPVAMAVMGTIESGVWTLDQKLTLEEVDRAREPSMVDKNPTGTQFTVRQLLEALLIHSDNTALMILLRNVPQSELDAVRDGLGLEDVFNLEGEVTAREYSRIFRSLYTANYLSRANSQLLLEMLDKAEWDHFLSKTVPATIPFPHKYGIEPAKGTYSDSGVVYVPNRPFLITVMIEASTTQAEPTDEQVAQIERVMAAMSNMSLEYFTTAKNRDL